MIEARPQRPQAGDPLRIVLIDDNPEDRDHLRRMLLAGLTRRVQIVEAATGEQGIIACSEVGRIDCVVLDFHLPDMTGLDVLDALREQHGEMMWPVVVLTSSMGGSEPASVLRSGAEDFVSKDWISPESMARAIENARERHSLTRELRQAEERLRLALSAANIGTWEWNLATDQVIWSEGHFRILGYEMGAFEPTFEHWRSRVHPEDLARVEAAIDDALKLNDEYQCEYRVIRLDGCVRWVQARGRHLLATGRAVQRMYGILLDITESRLATDALARQNVELETEIAERTAQLVQAQKLDVVGQITGALAHDFNNLLAAIQGNLDVLRRRLEGDSDALKLIDGALQGTGRGSDLTKRLLSFVRREQLQSRSVDVLTLLHGMDDLLRRSVGPMIDIRIDAAADLWPATVDPSQLELALLNLAVNARDALPSGGTITIRLQNERVAGGAPYPAELRAGDYVRITVDDTGVGMDPATLARATEPFFTTKSGGRGTGLGLSSVHGLALQSHGALRLTSGCNVGTTVELWLPRVSEATGALPLSDHAKPSGNPAPGKLNVLLVEDDALIAMSTQAVLEDLGHDVRVALSGAKALDLLRADPNIELVITDLAMPIMTGLELAERIRATWPRMPILLATGYGDGIDGTLDLPRITKPYRQRDLANAIREVMSGYPARFATRRVSLRRDQE